MFNRGYFGKMMDRRRFLLTAALATPLGLTFPLGMASAAERDVRLANYDPKRQTVETLRKRAVTLSNNSDVILRTATEARKAVLSVCQNGKYALTGCCVRFAGRVFFVTANHCLEREVSLKSLEFENVELEKFVLRFYDDAHETQDNTIFVINWLYCNKFVGDFTVFELKNAGTPYVLDISTSSLSVADQAELLCVNEFSAITPYRCHVKEINHCNDNGLNGLILLDVADNKSELKKGYSGSPLVTADGKFCAMLIQRYRPTEFHQWQGGVVPAAKIFKNVAKQFNFGYLGAYVAAGAELTVRRVDRNSPAEKAGILVGDTILAFDDTRVENFTDFQRELSYRGSRKGTVTVKRRDKIVRLDVAFAGMRSA